MASVSIPDAIGADPVWWKQKGDFKRMLRGMRIKNDEEGTANQILSTQDQAIENPNSLGSGKSTLP